MGVLSRFERRLERSVEGAFARVFKGHVEPVEVAQALQREAEERRAVMGRGRVLVPNEYVVELGPADADRLGPYAVPLSQELASLLREHATEKGWSFAGPVRVRLVEVEDLDTGVCRVRSDVATASAPGQRSAAAPGGPGPAAPAVPGPAAAPAARARVVVPGPDGSEQEHPLGPGVIVVGRGSDADLRLDDTGVSRRHAELRVTDLGVEVVDLGSTNGTTVNGRRVERAVLDDGDRVELGRSALVLRLDRPRERDA